MSVRDDTLAASKLTRTEFAVVRAYAQGMPAVEIANRYLLDPDEDEALTEHQAVQRILRLRDRLVQFALQNDRPDIAAMFDNLKGRSNIAMDRRVDALSSLERLSPGRPALEHAVSLWFRPSLSRRLRAAGIERIHDLVQQINVRGTAWWRGVPRLGLKSAGIVADWLARHRPVLLERRGETGGGAAAKVPWLGPQVGAPTRPRDWAALPSQPLDHRLTYPVPLEKMLPSTLREGSVRDAGAALRYAEELGEELDEIGQWLIERSSRPNTLASYRRESERLLLWCALRRRSLRSLHETDLDSYLAFLADPQPAAFWQGPAGPRDRVNWRPFERGLSPASRDAALRVLRVLLRRLRENGLMSHDPCPRVPARSLPATTRPEAARDGVLHDPVALRAFADWLQREAEAGRRRAANAAAWLAVAHGLGPAEMANLRCGALDTLPAVAGQRSGGQTLETAADSDAGCRDTAMIAARRRAMALHWQDRGLTSAPEPDLPALGPGALPPTPRSRAKLARTDGAPAAGYSRGGLERLLRRAWAEFVAQPAHSQYRAHRFTPLALARLHGRRPAASA